MYTLHYNTRVGLLVTNGPKCQEPKGGPFHAEIPWMPGNDLPIGYAQSTFAAAPDGTLTATGVWASDWAGTLQCRVQVPAP